MCNLSCNPPPCLAFSPTGRSLSFLSRGVKYSRSLLEFFVAEKLSVETDQEDTLCYVMWRSITHPLHLIGTTNFLELFSLFS